jgi:acyl-[acyl-carrier-protein] desaturase
MATATEPTIDLSATDLAFLDALEPKVTELLERHLETTRQWYPHEVVPWERGSKLDWSKDWDPREFPLPDAVRAALFVNLLTEDNLPYYFETLARVLRGGGAWADWSHRWTAEEARHGMVLRDYLVVSQAVDPWKLEDARMSQMQGAVVPQPPNVPEILAYVTLQELATRISHKNTGRVTDDPAGYEIMKRIATDENYHHLFYRDLMSALIEYDASSAVIAIEKQVREFAMPGTGIKNFSQLARQIADAGIYDMILHHEQILVPIVIRFWKINELVDLTPEAEVAREKLVNRIDRIGKMALRLKERREESAAEGTNESLLVTSSN